MGFDLRVPHARPSAPHYPRVGFSLISLRLRSRYARRMKSRYRLSFIYVLGALAATTLLPYGAVAAADLPGHSVPAGLHAIEGRSGGRIVEGPLAKASSPDAAFRAGLARVRHYFDRAPHVVGAVRRQRSNANARALQSDPRRHAGRRLHSDDVRRTRPRRTSTCSSIASTARTVRSIRCSRKSARYTRRGRPPRPAARRRHYTTSYRRTEPCTRNSRRAGTRRSSARDKWRPSDRIALKSIKKYRCNS